MVFGRSCQPEKGCQSGFRESLFLLQDICNSIEKFTKQKRAPTIAQSLTQKRQKFYIWLEACKSENYFRIKNKADF